MPNSDKLAYENMLINIRYSGSKIPVADLSHEMGLTPQQTLEQTCAMLDNKRLKEISEATNDFVYTLVSEMLQASDEPFEDICKLAHERCMYQNPTQESA